MAVPPWIVLAARPVPVNAPYTTSTWLLLQRRIVDLMKPIDHHQHDDDGDDHQQQIIQTIRHCPITHTIDLGQQELKMRSCSLPSADFRQAELH